MFKFKFKFHFGKTTIILLAVLAVLLAADLITKYLEEAYDWNFVVIPKLIWVQSGVRNNNVAFGMGEEVFSKSWGKALLIGGTTLFCLALVVGFLLVPERFLLCKICLVMVISGAIGNIVDRMIFGNVRDFVWLNMLFTEACCNFADFWIVIGGILLMIDVAFLDEFAIIPLTKKAKLAQKEEGDK